MEKVKNNEAGKKVVLTLEQYDALMSRLDELEAQEGGEDDDEGQGDKIIEKLSNIGKSKSGSKKVASFNFDDMSMGDFAKYIGAFLQENVIRPMSAAIEGVKLEIEEDKLLRDGKAVNYEKVREDVYKTAASNPNLSLRQAYDLVLKDKGLTDEPKAGGNEGELNDNKNKSDKGAKGNEDLLKTLPPRVPGFSEKPRGFSKSIDQEEKGDEEISTRDAATEAWEELGLKD